MYRKELAAEQQREPEKPFVQQFYVYIQTSEDGYDYTLYNKDFTVMDGGIIEVDGYRPVQEMMEEVLAEHGHSVSECGVISTAYLQEQSYRAETQRAEAMKEKLAAEKPAPEANISFYVAECAEFPVMGEFHDNLTLEQALEIYDIPKQSFMERPIDCKAGYKHHVTNEYLKHLQKSLMDLCRREFLHGSVQNGSSNAAGWTNISIKPTPSKIRRAK